MWEQLYAQAENKQPVKGETATVQKTDNSGADSAKQGQPQGSGNLLWIMIAMILIFYFILIRPQQKKQKQLQKKRESLKKGDEIITGGGLKARVTQVREKEPTLKAELSNGVEVEVYRSTIMQVVDPAAAQKQAANKK
ncbi:MAG TPA: preprotein translocase subunit YajC [Spirochaetota bacterium]|nr:preprotein translocase subunit YajC [Spirochaetota bacterium]